ncbi:unnamed protein product [Brugia timori]|uniref:Uncharacterized protein n=1 Tax=Brugia timori TaxID=42155 RepID=A0A0R3QVI4_9BILA|nr:unnamed protein product [Brugia timori]
MERERKCSDVVISFLSNLGVLFSSRANYSYLFGINSSFNF